MKKFVAYQIENAKLFKRLLAIVFLSAASATYLVDTVLAASLNSVSTYNSADSNAFETIQLRTTRTLPAQVVPPQLLAQFPLPNLTPKLTEIASITSAPTPLDGQNARSSGNFSNQVPPANTVSYLWVVLDVNGMDVKPDVTFDVKRDRSLASDPTIFSGLKYGDTTRAPLPESRSWYIANPKGAGNQNFLVKLYAVGF